MIFFPELSRKPALKTRGSTLDPTLRDSMENGAEATGIRWTKRRRQWTVTIEALTPDDYDALEDFVVNQAMFGANIFSFPDVRNPKSPQSYLVRFSTIPDYTDTGSVEGEFRQNCTFVLREV